MKKIKIKIIKVFIIIKQQYKKIKNLSIIKFFLNYIKRFIFSLILYLFMPETFMNSTNFNENDKMLFMAFFVVFSFVISYTLQNYECKPGVYTNPSIHSWNSWLGWKSLLIRIISAAIGPL